MLQGSVSALSKLSIESVKQFLDSFDTVLTDCDGVLWIGRYAIEGSAEVLNRLRSLGKNIFYVTNNSTKTREEFVTKCNELNFSSKKEEIISTAYLTANYLKSLGFSKKVYIIGESGIATELDLVGIKHLEIGPDPIDKESLETLSNVKLDGDVGAVIIGYDIHISMPKMIKAASYLKNPDCLFIATNADQRYPYNSTLTMPGTGCLVASIQTCTQREPVIIGKPNSYILDFLISHHNIDPKRTLMIGDNCKTDILLGTRCGFQTLLVLTGITSLSQVMEWKESTNDEHKGLLPDVYLEKLGDLLEYLN